MIDTIVALLPDEPEITVDPQKDIKLEFGDKPDNIIATLDIEESCEEFPVTAKQDEDVEFYLDTPIIVQHTGADPYTGSYVVVPSFEQQSLETRNKFMKKDIEVEAIAVSRVSNLSGGTTVYIGGKFDG